MYLKKLFSSFKIFNILFVSFIISIYLLHSTNSHSQEDSTNNTPQQQVTINGVKYSPTTPTNNNPQEVTINGVKYTQTSPQNNTTPQNNTNTPTPTPPSKTQSTLKISDLIVGGYVSAGYLFNLGPTFNSDVFFYTSGDGNLVSDIIRPVSKDGDAFYVKLGYQSIMLGVEAELRSKSNLTHSFQSTALESNVVPVSSIKIHNEGPEFGFNFYLDFLSSKKYLLAPIFGVSISNSSTQILSNNQIYTDSSSLTKSVKYGILYRQFVYKNIGLEVSWYGETRWNKNSIEPWSNSITYGDQESTYNNSEFSIGIVYDF